MVNIELLVSQVTEKGKIVMPAQSLTQAECEKLYETYRITVDIEQDRIVLTAETAEEKRGGPPYFKNQKGGEIMKVKELEKMSLGELIDTMISLSIQHYDRLAALDGRGSPYASEEEIKRTISKEYQAKIESVKKELNKREKLFR